MPRLPNLSYAGDYCDNRIGMTTIESAVTSGLEAAAAIVARRGGKPVEIREPRALPQPLLYVDQRRPEPAVAERLQQVVGRVDLERPERVLLEGGDDHDQRKQRRRHFAQRLEAVASRHPHVQEREVRPVRDDRVCRLRPGAALGHDLDLGIPQQQQLQRPPARRLVVGDDGANPAHCAHGISSATTVSFSELIVRL